jgi:hypothetical protein
VFNALYDNVDHNILNEQALYGATTVVFLSKLILGEN